MKNDVWNTEELSTIQNSDRILPSQPYFSKQYVQDQSEFYGRLNDLILAGLDYKRVEDKWNIVLKPGVTYASLGSEIGTLYFYQFLIRTAKAKNILELGTYVGVSALFLAEAANWAGHVTTIEVGREFYDLATLNIENNGYENRITQLLGDALEYLNEFVGYKETFDFILIDAAKEAYKELLEASLKCLSPDGIILIDDIFFQGDTLNDEPTSEKGRGVRAMIDYANSLTEYSKIILPLGNGLMILTKNKPDLEPFNHAN